MMMSDADHKRIAEAVGAAEAKTSGDIFCIVSGEVSQYREVPLAWAAAVALIVPPVVLALVGLPTIMGWIGQAVTEGWSTQSARVTASEAIGVYAIAQGALFVLTAFIASIPPVRRALTPRFLKRHRVRRTAYAHFASTGLIHAPDRTGVLIFASLKDRQVEIVAEKAIHDAVGDKVWDAAVRALVDGMKRRDPGQGFVRAIGLCGEALGQHFPSTGPHENRFPDELVEV